MRRYELMLLLRPDLEDDKLQSAVEKVTRAIVNGGGSLSKVSPWGKRRLAYDIQNFREASYFLIHFDIEPSAVREIERGMLISEEILRHLVTVLEDRQGGGGGEDEQAGVAGATDVLAGSTDLVAGATEAAGPTALEGPDAPIPAGERERAATAEAEEAGPGTPAEAPEPQPAADEPEAAATAAEESEPSEAEPATSGS